MMKDGGLGKSVEAVLDPMGVVRERYERAAEADNENRRSYREDMRFLLVPGAQWEEGHRRRRKGRPTYEFNILRQQWRAVTARLRAALPSARIKAVEPSDAQGVQVRQALVDQVFLNPSAREAILNAAEHATGGGFGAFRVNTTYSSDDAFEQDIAIEMIADPMKVWIDPDSQDPSGLDAEWMFVEETISREAFRTRYPKAEVVNWETAAQSGYADWYNREEIRVCEYWRKEPVTKRLLLMSDGRTVDAEEVAAALDEMAEAGITVVREREVKTHRIVMSIVAGLEEIDGPHDWAGKYIPIVPIYGDRYFVDGRFQWSGVVRYGRDAQSLLNYNLTAQQEMVSKQPKVPFLVTPQMLEGKGVKELWDGSNRYDLPYLVYTPDERVEGGGPRKMSAPEFPSAFSQLSGSNLDMLKAVTGVYDASLGAPTAERSGKEILARQSQADRLTSNYADAVGNAVTQAGRIVMDLLPKIYDTERVVRTLGPDGREGWARINAEVIDNATGELVRINDLSSGKYDFVVDSRGTGQTGREMLTEFLSNVFSQQPNTFALFGDIFFRNMDNIPGSQELAERARVLLPPQLANGADGAQQAQEAMEGEIQARQQQLEAEFAQRGQDMEAGHQAAVQQIEKAKADANREIQSQAANLMEKEKEINEAKVEIEKTVAAAMDENEKLKAAAAKMALQLENKEREQGLRQQELRLKEMEIISRIEREERAPSDEAPSPNASNEASESSTSALFAQIEALRSRVEEAISSRGLVKQVVISRGPEGLIDGASIVDAG